MKLLGYGGSGSDLYKRWKVVIIIITVVLVAVAAYYVSFFSAPKYVSPTFERSVVDGTRAEVSKDGFVFEVSVDKLGYDYGEPVVVKFKLTYLGGPSFDLGWSPIDFPFEVEVRNETHSVMGTRTLTGPVNRITLYYGESLSGMAVVGNSRIQYYWGEEKIYENRGPNFGVLGFTPGSIHYVDSSAVFGLYEKPQKITASSIKISVKDE